MKDLMNVKIAPECMEKIRFWVDKSPVEISGLGKCKNVDGTWYVTNVYLLEQENTAASTDLDAEAVAKLECEVMREEGHLNFWWHSHVNMGVFWSGTDTQTMADFGKHGMVLATVFNKRGEMRSAYYQNTDKEGFYPRVFIDEIPTEIGELVDYDSRHKEWEAEYTKKCRKPVYKTPVTAAKTANVRPKTRQRSDYIKVLPKLSDLDFKVMQHHFTDSVYIHEWGGFASRLDMAMYLNMDGNKGKHLTVLTEPVTTNTITASTIYTTDALDTDDGIHLNGEINPAEYDERWDMMLDKWVSYDDYNESYPQDLDENILSRQQRLDATVAFVTTNARIPCDDLELDDFYMKTMEMSPMDYYL